MKKKIPEILMVSVFAAIMAIMLSEWASGCGEPYFDAYDNLKFDECTLIGSNR
jgi:hypothetical protein